MVKAARFRHSRLQRRRAIRDPRPRFILFCEGTNSEPLYFAALGRRLLGKVVIDPRPGSGSPDAIADRAIAEASQRGFLSKNKSRVDWFARGDQIWAVFDRDQWEHFDAAVKKCEQNGIFVARSNPCFEVWLILHVQDFHKPIGRHEVFEHFCKLRPDYKDGKGRNCNFDTLVQEVERAEERATRQLADREAERQPFGAPSTTVHQLTQVLKERAS